MFLYSVLINQELQYRPLSNNSQRYAPYINTGPHNKVQYPNNRYKYNHSHLLSCFGFHPWFHLCSVSTNKANTPKELCKITKTHVIKSVYGKLVMLCYSQYLNVKSLQLHWLLVWDRIQHNVCLSIYFVSVLLYYLLWKLCKKSTKYIHDINSNGYTQYTLVWHDPPVLNRKVHLVYI